MSSYAFLLQPFSDSTSTKYTKRQRILPKLNLQQSFCLKKELKISISYINVQLLENNRKVRLCYFYIVSKDITSVIFIEKNSVFLTLSLLLIKEFKRQLHDALQLFCEAFIDMKMLESFKNVLL